MPQTTRDVSNPLANRPRLVIDRESRQGSRCIDVCNLEPDLLALLGRCAQTDYVLQSIFRVSVVETGMPLGDEVPNVFGRYQVLKAGIRFVPHFPFESGIRYRAIFDPRPLGRPALSDVLTLEFSLPSRMGGAIPTHVTHVFPSDDSLPENLLRFYISFSNSMQRGRAEEQIRVLGADGRPASDVLYRPPVELWDRSMRHLTILLDPGRLKRGVGPNRKLGPPLAAGEDYTLTIGSEMLDLSGRPLRQSCFKRFRATEAVRESIAVERWKIVPPATKTLQPLVLTFPNPMDWALLWHTITIASHDGQQIPGRIAIDECERRWSFTPTSPWAAGLHTVRVAPTLEDVCGNSLRGAFDRPLRSGGDMLFDAAYHSIPFRPGDQEHTRGA